MCVVASILSDLLKGLLQQDALLYFGYYTEKNMYKLRLIRGIFWFSIGQIASVGISCSDTQLYPALAGESTCGL